MKEMKQSAVYTAREIIEIIERAKKAGVVSIRVPGFEADWQLPQPPVASQQPLTPIARPALQVAQGVQPIPPAAPNTARAPICRTCRSEMQIGRNSGRFYCQACYEERKKTKGQWR
jgi:hypothetical protein